MKITMDSAIKWQAIPEFPEYECSNSGRVRRSNGCELLSDIDDRGRKRFTLCVKGKTYKIFAARLVLLTFIGPCPNGMEACHNNGNERDNHLDNLRWDTHLANISDKRKHGTMTQGEKVHTAKLTAADVLEIRRIGGPLKQHAIKFGVSTTLVSLIIRRKIWKHI